MTFNIISIIKKIYYDNINIDKNYQRNCKYTMDLYIAEIIKVLKSTHSWRKYNGKIDGRILNNKHNELCKLNVYNKAYAYILSNYIKINRMIKLKYQSIDTSFIPNKQCSEKLKRNKYYKGKKGLKISTIVDVNGIPLSILLINGNCSDMISLIDTVNKIQINTNTIKYKNHNRYKQYFLADKGYDSKSNTKFLVDNGYIPIIPINKRNTKIKSIKQISIKYKAIYKKRIIVENYFMKIKKYPKINNIYEKTIVSYNGLVLIASIILFEFV